MQSSSFILVAITVTVVLQATTTVISAQPITPPEILWREEFDYGTDVVPDPNIWKFDVGGGGWGNGELQTYTSDNANVRVTNGHLYITAISTNDPDKPFTSGRINTDTNFLFKYGTITMKAIAPNVVKGLWPAFWTLGQTFSSAGWPTSGEIDVMELGQGLGINEGVGNRRIVSAAHWDDNGQYATNAGWTDYSGDVNGTYHYYTLDWTPTAITTYIDDTQVWTMDISGGTPAALHDFHFIVLSLAVGGGFTSGGSSSSSAGCGSSSAGGSSGDCGPLLTPSDITAPLPASLEIDWIRVFNNGNTIISTTPTPAPQDLGVVEPVPVPVPVVAPVPVPVSEPVPAPVAAPVPVPVPVDVPVAAPFTVAPVVPVATTPTVNVLPEPTAPIVVAPVMPVAPVPVVPTTAAPTLGLVSGPSNALAPDGNIIFRPIFNRRPSRQPPVSTGGKGKGGKGKGGKGSDSSSKGDSNVVDDSSSKSSKGSKDDKAIKSGDANLTEENCKEGKDGKDKEGKDKGKCSEFSSSVNSEQISSNAGTSITYHTAIFGTAAVASTILLLVSAVSS